MSGSIHLPILILLVLTTTLLGPAAPGLRVPLRPPAVAGPAGGAPLLDLDVVDARASSVLRGIEKELGQIIRFDRPALERLREQDPPVTLRLEAVSAEEAARAVLTQAGLEVVLVSGGLVVVEPRRLAVAFSR